MSQEEAKTKLINNLPYPIGLLYRNLCKSYLDYMDTGLKKSLPRELFSFGYSCSHLFALINLTQYLNQKENRCPSLNKQILKTFRTKKATRWGELLLSHLEYEEFNPFIEEFAFVKQKEVPPEILAPLFDGDPPSENYLGVFKHFLTISQETPEEKLEFYFELLGELLKEYHFLMDYFLIVPDRGFFWLCQGTQPKLTKLKTPLAPSKMLEGHLLLLSKSQEVLDLHPFMVMKKYEHENPELHFIDQEISSRIHYIGYGTNSLHLDNELGEGILSNYQKMVVSLKNYSLTTRVSVVPHFHSNQLEDLIQFYLQSFVGREEELRAIEHFIEMYEKGYGTLIGRSGVGKNGSFLQNLF